MRDPARIDELLDLLRAYWKRNPDLRLGQIICNAMREVTKNDDPFYLEDDALIDLFRNETKQENRNAEVDAQTPPKTGQG